MLRGDGRGLRAIGVDGNGHRLRPFRRCSLSDLQKSVRAVVVERERLAVDGRHDGRIAARQRQCVGVSPLSGSVSPAPATGSA